MQSACAQASEEHCKPVYLLDPFAPQMTPSLNDHCVIKPQSPASPQTIPTPLPYVFLALIRQQLVDRQQYASLVNLVCCSREMYELYIQGVDYGTLTLSGSNVSSIFYGLLQEFDHDLPGPKDLELVSPEDGMIPIRFDVPLYCDPSLMAIDPPSNHRQKQFRPIAEKECLPGSRIVTSPISSGHDIQLRFTAPTLARSTRVSHERKLEQLQCCKQLHLLDVAAADAVDIACKRTITTFGAGGHPLPNVLTLCLGAYLVYHLVTDKADYLLFDLKRFLNPQQLCYDMIRSNRGKLFTKEHLNSGWLRKYAIDYLASREPTTTLVCHNYRSGTLPSTPVLRYRIFLEKDADDQRVTEKMWTTHSDRLNNLAKCIWDQARPPQDGSSMESPNRPRTVIEIAGGDDIYVRTPPKSFEKGRMTEFRALLADRVESYRRPGLELPVWSVVTSDEAEPCFCGQKGKLRVKRKKKEDHSQCEGVVGEQSA
ncbi:hypothetical protein P7C73_g416, partial [Tremellales sp. Uapishka_1]